MMKTIHIGSACLTVKDYHCAGADGSYILKSENLLWLYINLTNRCNASCPFCVNPMGPAEPAVISTKALRRTLIRVRPWVRGISITGGEPMLYPELVDAAASVAVEVFGSNEILFERSGLNA